MLVPPVKQNLRWEKGGKKQGVVSGASPQSIPSQFACGGLTKVLFG